MSATDNLEDLKIGPPFLRDAFKRRDIAIKENKPLPGANTAIDTKSDGSRVNALVDAGHRIAPFGISLRMGPGFGLQYQVAPGPIYSGIGARLPVTITGLIDWIDTTMPRRIYLHGELTSGTLTGVTVADQAPGTDWPDPVVFSGSDQTEFNVPIGEILNQNNVANVSQITSTALVLSYICYGGQAALYPMPGA